LRTRCHQPLVHSGPCNILPSQPLAAVLTSPWSSAVRALAPVPGPSLSPVPGSFGLTTRPGCTNLVLLPPHLMQRAKKHKYRSESPRSCTWYGSESSKRITRESSVGELSFIEACFDRACNYDPTPNTHISQTLGANSMFPTELSLRLLLATLIWPLTGLCFLIFIVDSTGLSSQVANPAETGVNKSLLFYFRLVVGFRQQ
jgi:hypothetical protein